MLKEANKLPKLLSPNVLLNSMNRMLDDFNDKYRIIEVDFKNMIKEPYTTNKHVISMI
jgi:hypothetical protein